MINEITPGSFPVKPNSGIVVMQRTNNDGIVQERFVPLKEKDVFLTQTNKSGKPKSGLSRIMTEEEAVLSRDVSSPKRQTYIDLIDSGLSAHDAALIAKNAPKIAEYSNLISEDENGKPVSGASRVLTKKEAAFYVIEGGHSLTPGKLQDFIDLVDEGVDLKDCKNLLARKVLLDRYHTLTKKDENGNPKSNATRVLTKDEALTFIYGNLTARNVQNFIDVIDAGVPAHIAIQMAQNSTVVKNFLNYVLTDSFGNPLSGLSRSMTVDEAIYASTRHKGNKERLLYEIDNGIFQVPKRLDITG